VNLSYAFLTKNGLDTVQKFAINPNEQALAVIGTVYDDETQLN
jgi:hypothetical protein